MPYKPVLAILSLCVVCAAAPPVAGAASNAATTQTYLNANLALLRTSERLANVSEAAWKRILAQVRRECPAVATESPQNYDSEQLSNELVGDLIVSGTAPIKGPIARFARAVSGLRWSSARLTKTIHAYAIALTKEAAMPPPNLCGDVRAWVTGRYQTLPPSTVAFNASYKAVNVPVGELPEALLAPYEQPGQRGLLRTTRALEQAQADFEARAPAYYGEIMNELVLQP